MEHSSSLHKLKSNSIRASKISISILVISLPFLYAFLLHLSLSSLLKDTTFWFLISNSIIVIVAADSGVFGGTQSSSEAGGDLYDEYVRHCRAKSLSSVTAVSAQPETLVEEIKEVIQSSETVQLQPAAVIVDKKEDSSLDEVKPEDEVVTESQTVQEEEEEEKEIVQEEEEEAKEEEKEEEKKDCVFATTKMRRSAAAMVERPRSSCGMEENEYWEMSDEELNRKVEEFIRRFNREIRLQERTSTAVC